MIGMSKGFLLGHSFGEGHMRDKVIIVSGKYYQISDMMNNTKCLGSSRPDPGICYE